MNYLDYMIPKYQNAGKILVPWATNGEKEGDTREGSYGKETLVDGRWMPTRDQKWYEKLSESDWYTLGSIVGDLTGLGLGAAGLSPAAAVAGAASTTSQLIGDIKRDGFQWRDLGSAALGYGLDAATFIPGLGELASGFKNSKKLAKIAPWIIKTFGAGMSALGVTSAVPALEKAAKGEHLTMDDYRAITNGLMGVVGFKNTFSKSGNANAASSQNQAAVETQNGKSVPTNYYAQSISGDYQPPESLSLLNKVIQDKKTAIAKNAVLVGDSKGYRNQGFKHSPLQGTATTSLEDLMLINRVGADKVQFQNGMLVWPQKKLSSDKVNRKTVHFTTDQSVKSHGYGSWDAYPTTIMFPYRSAVEYNGNPINIEPMDTYWANPTSFQIPSNQIKMFTGDLEQATLARLNGVNVTFSKDAFKLNKQLKTLNDEIDGYYKANNYLNLSGTQWEERGKQIDQEIRNLEKQMRDLHENYIQSHQKAPTLEDYQTLERETGLKSGVEEYNSFLRHGYGPDDTVNHGLLYNRDPRTHARYEGEAEFQSPEISAKTWLFDLKNTVIDDLGWYASNKDAANQQLSFLTSPGRLVLFQKNFQSLPKETQTKLAEVYSQLLERDFPNSDIIKRIINGEKVYHWKLGGKMNYLDFFKSGSKIHIKKKNQGKFRDFCGGEVTEECIERGKHSSNPTTRKRATFAANARTWKHQDGGKTKKTFFTAIHPDFDNADLSGMANYEQLPRVVGITPDYMKPYNLPTIGEETPFTITSDDTSTTVTLPTPTTKEEAKTMEKELKALAKLMGDKGVKVKITSLTRAGAKTSNGRASYHATGNAMDIVPLNGDFAALKNLITNDPEIRAAFEELGVGVLDETTPEMLARTGGTGAHFHIGPDKAALATTQKWWSES